MQSERRKSKNKKMEKLVAVSFVAIMLPLGLFILLGQLRDTAHRLRERRQLQVTKKKVEKRQLKDKDKVALKAERRSGKNPDLLERIRRRIKKAVSKRTASSTPGTYVYPDTSREGMMELYKDAYRRAGIRDEDYNQMMAMDQVDREYQDSLHLAQRAMEYEDYTEARDKIREALSSLRSDHLIARMRLLDLLREIELMDGKPGEASEVLRELRETRIRAGRIVARALQDAGFLSTAEAEKMLESLETADDLRSDFGRVAELFAPEGTDPKEAPKRLGTIIATIVNNHERVGEE